MNAEKKLYTLLVYSENIAGILNQITAVFTRRQVNIESLNVSASSIKNIHKYTITAWTSMRWDCTRYPHQFLWRTLRFQEP